MNVLNWPDLSMNIAPDKRVYPHKIFLISLEKDRL